MRDNHDLQLFLAFAICFGFAALSGFFGLSTALGAFIAGLFVSSSKSTKWFHDGLYSFKVIFVALFFVSVGMLINIDFLTDNLGTVLILVVATFLTNHIVNAVVVRFFKESWKDALYAGALLSQVGEFSFVLGSLAFYNGVITDSGYQVIISVIALSLLLSPFWIRFSKKMLGMAGDIPAK